MKIHRAGGYAVSALLLLLNGRAADAGKGGDVLSDLKAYLERPADKREPLEKQAFAKVALSKAEAKEAQQLLWSRHAGLIRRTRAEELKSRELKDGKLSMSFSYEIFGPKPPNGRSLFISMHGGGNAPKEVNVSAAA